MLCALFKMLPFCVCLLPLFTLYTLTYDVLIFYTNEHCNIVKNNA